MYLWEHVDWPNFNVDWAELELRLQEVLALQSKLVGKVETLSEGQHKQAQMDALLQSAIKTSAIEGENLNVESVRSSITRHLGLEQSAQESSSESERESAVVNMLSSALDDLRQPITKETLCQWQSLLFVVPPLINKIHIGKFRDDALGVMQVISQRTGKTTVHYEAPPAKIIDGEIRQFLRFYHQSSSHHDVLKAALTHLYFISLHPFDDGNGRVARALTDRVLAQAENTSVRFYSLSAAIEKNKESYYQILEDTQNGRNKVQSTNPLNVTDWVKWFLDVLSQAIEAGILSVERVLIKAKFWQQHAQTPLTERQIKVLNRLLDSYGIEFQQGIAARHYKSIANVSKATATRDLAELQSKGCIQITQAGGRSARYLLNHD